MQQSEAESLTLSLSSNYSDLMQKVGNAGRYQLQLVVIFAITWFVSGVVMMSNGFMFMENDFDCTGVELSDNSSCKDYVCQLTGDQFEKYLLRLARQNRANVRSLISAFGDYRCGGDPFFMDLVKSCTFFGGFIGSLCISNFANRYGRRTSMIATWGLTTIGAFLLSCSMNLNMAAIGLFLLGFGSNSAITVSNYIVCQVISDQQWQQYLIVLNAFYSTGLIVMTGCFYCFQDWRMVSVCVLVFPSIAALILLVLHLQETPKDLLKLDVESATAALNRISHINSNSVKQQEEPNSKGVVSPGLSRHRLVTGSDIESVRSHKQRHHKHDQEITSFDLLRYKSLRMAAIACCLISYAANTLYLGPTMIIQDIGSNVYQTNILMNTADLISYGIAYYFTAGMERKMINMRAFLGVAVLSLLITRLRAADCLEGNCITTVLELVCILLYRFCICLEVVVFNVFQSELFPGQARATAISVISSVGMASSIAMPTMLGVMARADAHPMFMMAFFGMIGCSATGLLSETKDKEIKEEIEEMQVVSLPPNEDQRQFVANDLDLVAIP